MTPRALVLGLLDLLAPVRCPGCDEALDPDPNDLPPIDPFTDGFCVVCAALVEPFEGEQALYQYGGPLAEAIKRFKYEGRLDALPALTRLVARAAPDLSGEVDAVVPVPLFPRRRHTRGFDQAALLARPLARALGVPLSRAVLRRVRDTPPQARLDAAGRERNVQGAFLARRIEGQRLLHFDDVHTTGATLVAAQDALFDAGASTVISLSLAGRS